MRSHSGPTAPGRVPWLGAGFDRGLETRATATAPPPVQRADKRRDPSGRALVLRVVREAGTRGWTALSRHSQTRSTPKAGSQSQLLSAPCSTVTATPLEALAASTATPRSKLRLSMLAARDLQKRSMGF